MIVGCIGLGALGPILLMVISRGEQYPAFFSQWFIGILLCFYGGPISAWLVEKFPPKVRLTSASLGYDLAHSTASAFTPLIATILAQNVSLTAAGVLYPCFAILGLFGMFISTNINKSGGLDDIETEETLENVAQKEGEAPGGEEEEQVERQIV